MTGRGIGTAIMVVIVDQLSKYVVLEHFGVTACTDRREPVTAFLELVLTCNRGMSFGLFNAGSGLSVPLFTIAAIVIVAVLVFWLSRAKSEMLASAIGLIIGGALGNVIDRLRFGGVIDFLYFHLGSWYWPAFNLADSAICIGVVVMLFDGLLSRRQLQANQEGDRLP
ncbi:MAG TPA: signal peptidase II [Stellaceae bacterium]|jgi:signal peptidase II|nr:signal peptidase II [Stellaceae bacterium]